MRTIFNLLQRNRQSFLEVTINDSLLEDARTGNVAPFAQVDERFAHVLLVRIVVERQQTG